VKTHGNPHNQRVITHESWHNCSQETT
jgi:hypothetical protein